MAGLPKKFAKLGFAKGWKAFKASRKTKHAAPKAAKKVGRRKSRATAPKEAPTRSKAMAKVSHKKFHALKARASAALKSARNSGNVRTIGQAAEAAAIGIGAGVASSMALGAVPVGNAMVKSAVQAALGLYLMSTKNKMAKYGGMGLAVLGGASLVKSFLPAVPTMAGEAEELMGYGDGRNLSDSEFAELRGERSELMGARATLAGEWGDTGWK